MHDIEPYYHWREKYVASDDKRTPFYGKQYNEFAYTEKIYNYYIHPQWDNFGSPTLYTKLLYVDYEVGFCIFEMIGEWNDCLTNDVMFLKRDVVDEMIPNGINKYIIICENVLNFHSGDNDYYEEWYEDIAEDGGWIAFVNTQNHVDDELKEAQIQYYVNFGEDFNGLNWRKQKPKNICKALDALIHGGIKRLRY